MIAWVHSDYHRENVPGDGNQQNDMHLMKADNSQVSETKINSALYESKDQYLMIRWKFIYIICEWTSCSDEICHLISFQLRRALVAWILCTKVPTGCWYGMWTSAPTPNAKRLIIYSMGSKIENRHLSLPGSPRHWLLISLRSRAKSFITGAQCFASPSGIVLVDDASLRLLLSVMAASNSASLLDNVRRLLHSQDWGFSRQVVEQYVSKQEGRWLHVLLMAK